MAKIKGYIPRLAENSLKRKLKSSGCVIVSGPKLCGKSTLCERFAKSITALKTTNDIEIASDKNIAYGISSLNNFENKMRKNVLKTPAFKMVLTSHGSSRKEEGVYVVPISMLGL